MFTSRSGENMECSVPPTNLLFHPLDSLNTVKKGAEGLELLTQKTESWSLGTALSSFIVASAIPLSVISKFLHFSECAV